MQVRFRDLKDLSTLPWFSLNEEGRLVVKDRSLGPIADLHTHLALAFVRPMQLDLQAAPRETEHYLPGCCSLHLDVYVNENFTPEDLAKTKRDLTLGSLTASGMRQTHTVPNLLREMRELGITHSVILPIDFPALSSNSESALGAVNGHEGLIGFCSVHPYGPNPERKLDELVAMGAKGIKLHPNVQCFRPDARRAMRLYRAAGERNLPILWHCGPVGIEPALGRYLTQVRFYERPIAEHPRTQFILGHAGAKQAPEAVELQRKYPNVWLELSSQSVSSIKDIFRRADPDRIVYGTDWPWYHQAIGLAKVLMATDGKPELRHKVLFGNAARLLKLEA